MAKNKRSVDELYTEAKNGKRQSLGRLLTMVERGGRDAELISELAFPDSGDAHVVGITGAPGAGKSTLTGQLVSLLVSQGPVSYTHLTLPTTPYV